MVQEWLQKISAGVYKGRRVGTDYPQPVRLYGDGVVLPTAASGDGIAAATDPILRVLVTPLLWNGNNFDRDRANNAFAILASAARAPGAGSSTVSSTLTNHACRGVDIFLNVTANAGAGQDLKIGAQAYDAVTDTWYGLYESGALFDASNGGFHVQIHPGIVKTSAMADLAVQGVALPRQWRVYVTHSGAGSHTYSVSGCYIR